LIDLAGRYYLSNQEELIKEVITNSRALKNSWQFCLSDQSLLVGDFIDLNFDKLADSSLKNYFLQHNINHLQALSYSTSTISTIELCF